MWPGEPRSSVPLASRLGLLDEFAADLDAVIAAPQRPGRVMGPWLKQEREAVRRITMK